LDVQVAGHNSRSLGDGAFGICTLKLYRNIEVSVRVKKKKDFERTILHQIKDLKEAFSNSDNAATTAAVEGITDAINVVGGNQTIFGDEVFKRLEAMEERINVNISSAVEPLMEKITSLERNLNIIQSSSMSSDCDTPPSKRRKVQRNPDLSVSGFKLYDETNNNNIL
jgi:hypothetical protein